MKKLITKRMNTSYLDVGYKVYEILKKQLSEYEDFTSMQIEGEIWINEDGSLNQINLVSNRTKVDIGINGPNTQFFLGRNSSKHLIGYEYDDIKNIVVKCKKKKEGSLYDLFYKAHYDYFKPYEIKNDKDINAFLKFCQNCIHDEDYIMNQIKDLENINELIYCKNRFAFKFVRTAQYLNEHDIYRECWESILEGQEVQKGDCIVTGEKDVVLYRTTPKCVGSANFTSFNKPSLSSWGNTGSYNWPISAKRMKQASTGFRRLMENAITINNKRISKKFKCGNDVQMVMGILYGAENVDDMINSDNLYNAMSIDMMSYSEKEEDSKDRLERDINNVKELFKRIRSGKKITYNTLKQEEDMLINIFGVSTSQSNAILNYYYENSIEDFVKNIIQHHEDMELLDNKNAIRDLSISSIMNQVLHFVNNKKMEDKYRIEFMKSIIEGNEYGKDLIYDAMKCIEMLSYRCANNNIDKIYPNKIAEDYGIKRGLLKYIYQNIALLKANINPTIRKRSLKMSTITPEYNENIKEIGYKLGVLFYTVCNIQNKATQNNSIARKWEETGITEAMHNPLSFFNKALEKIHSVYLPRIEYDVSAGLRFAMANELKTVYNDCIENQVVPRQLNEMQKQYFFIGYYQYSMKKQKERIEKSKLKEKENNLTEE